jgi:hypothetical protein
MLTASIAMLSKRVQDFKENFLFMGHDDSLIYGFCWSRQRFAFRPSLMLNRDGTLAVNLTLHPLEFMKDVHL